MLIRVGRYTNSEHKLQRRAAPSLLHDAYNEREHTGTMSCMRTRPTNGWPGGRARKLPGVWADGRVSARTGELAGGRAGETTK